MNDYVYFKNEFVRLLDRLRLNNGLWEEGMIDDHLYQENIIKIEELFKFYYNFPIHDEYDINDEVKMFDPHIFESLKIINKIKKKNRGRW